MNYAGKSGTQFECRFFLDLPDQAGAARTNLSFKGLRGGLYEQLANVACGSSAVRQAGTRVWFSSNSRSDDGDFCHPYCDFCHPYFSQVFTGPPSLYALSRHEPSRQQPPATSRLRELHPRNGAGRSFARNRRSTGCTGLQVPSMSANRLGTSAGLRRGPKSLGVGLITSAA